MEDISKEREMRKYRAQQQKNNNERKQEQQRQEQEEKERLEQERREYEQEQREYGRYSPPQQYQPGQRPSRKTSPSGKNNNSTSKRTQRSPPKSNFGDNLAKCCDKMGNCFSNCGSAMKRGLISCFNGICNLTRKKRPSPPNRYRAVPQEEDNFNPFNSNANSNANFRHPDYGESNSNFRHPDYGESNSNFRHPDYGESSFRESSFSPPKAKKSTKYDFSDFMRSQKKKQSYSRSRSSSDSSPEKMIRINDSNRHFLADLDIVAAGNVSETDIKNAYRKLAKIYHPDKNKSAGAEDRFKRISHAYEVLTNKNGGKRKTNKRRKTKNH